MVALAQRGQGQGVGGGAVEGEEHLAIGFEQAAEMVGGARRPFVIAVGALVALVGLGHGGPGFGTDAGVVVAGELLGIVGHWRVPSEKPAGGSADKALTLTCGWRSGVRRGDELLR